MQCPNCGKTIDSGDPFCAYCGVPLQAKHTFPVRAVYLGAALVAVAVLLFVGAAIIIIGQTPTPTPVVVAYATSTTQPTLMPTFTSTRPPATPVPTAAPSPTVRPTETRPNPTAIPITAIPATPIVIVVTSTPLPSPTPTRTPTPTATPTPWFGFVSLRWEPSDPHWGDDVTFYATFNNTTSEPHYLSWLIEICRTDCPNWRVLMFQTGRKDDTVPPVGTFDVASSPPWPLRGQGGTQTYPVRFVHVGSGDQRTGEAIFYVTVSPR